jgi:N-acetyl sugar amidotransferase
MSIEHCKKCWMPSSRPRVTFTDGVCNACHWAEEKQRIDWDGREEEFRHLVRERRGNGRYDCIIPYSGGKDSSVVAYKVKQAGLHPLLVCYGQLMWTDVGRANFDRMCDLGFDILYFRHNQRVSRYLARRFFIERGHPKQHYDAGVNAVPLQAAVAYRIPLIFYAEHGESEYGGHILSEEHRRTRDLAEVLEHQVGDDPRNWADNVVSEADLAPYTLPDADEISRVGVRAFYFSYFFKWSAFENALFAQKELGFRGIEEPSDVAGHDLPLPGRSDGSFEGFDSIDDKIDDLDYYMMHLKFGFGRATRFASRMIQSGYMTREAALPLIRQYDGEFPQRYLPDILDYLGLGVNELREIADKHRNPEIWERKGHIWTLKHPPA